MSDTGEYSKGGAKILRHAASEGEGLRAAAHADDERIAAHLEATIGPIEMVFHELVSDLVHVDVHWIKATAARPFHVLVTSGMSARPMTVPEGSGAPRFAELMALLPADWPMTQEAWSDERWYWPVRWLKLLARLPHEYRTWLGSGHTIPNGDPPQPFGPGTSMVCMMVMKSISLPMEARSTTLSDGSPLELYALYPLHPEEMQLKLAAGMDALLDAFDAARVPDVIVANRPSSVGRGGR